MEKTYTIDFIETRIVDALFSANITINVEEDDTDFSIIEKLETELNCGNIKNEVFLKNMDEYSEKVELKTYIEI